MRHASTSLMGHKRKSRIVVDLAREQRQQLMLGSVKTAGAGVRFCPHDQIERRQSKKPLRRRGQAAGRATGSGLQLDRSSVPKPLCSSLKSHLVEADNQEITQMRVRRHPLKP
jgi:hypothetical protein